MSGSGEFVIPTGSYELDEALVGGFINRSFAVFVEEHGSLVEYLLTSILDSSLSYGAKVLYVSSLDSVREILEKLKRCLSENAKEKGHNLTVFDMLSKMPVVYTQGMPLRVSGVYKKTEDQVLTLIEEEDFDVVIIHNLPFLFEDMSEMETVKYAKELRFLARRKKMFVGITLPTNTLDQREENLIKALADYLIELRVFKEDSDIRRKMYLLKTPKLPTTSVVEYSVVDCRIMVESIQRVL